MSYGRVPLLIIIGGRAGVAVAGIVAVRFSTSFLNEAQQGTLYQVITLFNFFNMLLVIPVMHFMNRGFLEWFSEGRLVANTIKYFIFLILVALFSFSVSGILQWKLAIVDGLGIFPVALLVGLLILFQYLYTYGTGAYNLFAQRGKFVLFSNLTAWSSILFSIIFFTLYPNPFSWGLGQVLGFMLGSLSVVMIWKNLQNKEQLTVAQHHPAIQFNLNTIFAFSWPIMITSGLWWMQSQSYRFILERIHGLSIMGLFAVGYSLAAAPIAIYESVISQYLDPIFFGDLKDKDNDGKVKAWNNYARLYLPGLVLMGIFIAVAAPFLARILLGEAFRAAAIKITVWAAIIETMRASGGLLFHVGLAKVDNRMTIIPAAMGALLAPAGVFLFGRVDPLYGTIAGMMIAAIVVLVINIRQSYRLLPITWPFRRVLRTVLVVAPLIIGLPVVSFFFKQPGFIFSLVVLTISGIYVLTVQAFLLIKRQA